MLLFVALVFGFLVAVSSSVVTENTYDQLNLVLRGNLPEISRDQGKLTFGAGFSFVHNGVYTLVYSPASRRWLFPKSRRLKAALPARWKRKTGFIMSSTTGCRLVGTTAYGYGA